MRESDLRKVDLYNLKKLFDGFLLDWNEIQHHTGYSEKECCDILESIQRIREDHSSFFLQAH